jgi:hypothetical protein
MRDTITYSDVVRQYCGGDKGMANGWSVNWKSKAARESEGLETHCLGSLLVVYLCVLSLLSLMDDKGQTN